MVEGLAKSAPPLLNFFPKTNVLTKRKYLTTVFKKKGKENGLLHLSPFTENAF
jgi:hypothetical protein